MIKMGLIFMLGQEKFVSEGKIQWGHLLVYTRATWNRVHLESTQGYKYAIHHLVANRVALLSMSIQKW